MGKYLRWCFQGLGIVLLVFVIYILITGVLPYATQKKVSSEFKKEIGDTQFFSDTASIDRVALVEEPKASLDTRIFLIAQAEERLDVAYYSLEAGNATTDLFLAAILDAADRGVKVRLLVDGLKNFKGKYEAPAFTLAAHPNVEVRLYNPPQVLKPWTYNGRMHDKYIIVDDSLLLLGGRNIGDKYFNPEGFKKNLSIDRDVMVYNTAAGENDKTSVIFTVRDYMDAIWESSDTKPSFEESPEDVAVERGRLLAILDEVKKEFPLLFAKETDFYSLTHEANKITLLVNDINIGEKDPKVAYAIGEILKRAEQRVVLQSPYIVLDKYWKDLLLHLGEMNIDYEILTNSMASTPNFPAFSSYLMDKKKIVRTGASVYEFQSNHAIHSKTFLIDDRLSIVGSYNIDPRSSYIDTEMMLVIDSVGFNAELSHVLREYMARSLVCDEKGNYLPNDNVSAVEVSQAKKGALYVLGLLLKPLKFLI